LATAAFRGLLSPKTVETTGDRRGCPADLYNRPMHEVVVYSRKGCHLCDVVKETLTNLQGNRRAEFEWHEVDIDGDPLLQRKYNDEVPVVFIDGRKAFKYHMDGDRFLRALAGRA
jgi:glutaredoxin